MARGTLHHFGASSTAFLLRAFMTLTLAAILMLPGCGGGDVDKPAPPAAKDNAKPAPTGAIELVFPYGSEKKTWLTEATEAFNAQQHKTASGKPIFVRPIPMGSGESIEEVLSGRLQAHLISPASGAFIKLGNAQSVTKSGKPLVGSTKELVLSPVVIAMWKPMAEALGWGKKPVGWAEILALVRDPKGWGAHGMPQWGKFKFGHTHPQFSNSGIISLFAEVYAATGKTRDLTLEDIAKPATSEFLGAIEKAVVHYGSSTGFFGKRLFDGGPEYLSAAVLYENMVIESYDKQKYPSMPFPVVAVYPKEGTFWSDHPVGIVQREWVGKEHQEAAEKYIEYLLAKPQQERAMVHGFRPADPSVAIAAPIDKDHGVDPAEPKTTLEVPAVEVMDAIIKLWKQHKKHANVVLVLDTSGSMNQGGRLENARKGALELVNMLGDEDVLSFLQFDNDLNWVHRNLRMADNRAKMTQTIQTMIATGGTSLYDAVDEAYRYVGNNPDPERITAVIVLTDGEDRNSKLRLEQLLASVKSDAERRPIRVFTIGYGQEANGKILLQIAEQTQATFYKGTPENIREVFKDISTFF